MKKLLPFVVLGPALLTISMSGCGGDSYPAYSSSVKYGLRQDPILRQGMANQLGDERHEPDRPGVFPLMNLTDILKVDHPYYLKSRELLSSAMKKIVAETHLDADKLSEEERRKLEDQILEHPEKHRKELNHALDKILRNPAALPAKERQELEGVLEALFGTPAHPMINTKLVSMDSESIDVLKVDEKTLARGAAQYRVNCLHCHGVPGDGRGPTAQWINPHPRDFRAGKFKFQSINQVEQINRPPARADLLRTLRRGIEGTAMPSFNLLSDDDLESLVSYVIHLSVRGNVEVNVIGSGENIEFNPQTGELKWEGDESVTVTAKTAATTILNNWVKSQDPASTIKVESYTAKSEDMAELKASVLRGKQLFLGSADHPRGKSANCVSCHTDYGRQAKYRFDDWGTLVRPNNFVQGVFRGGRRPVDLYYRIHSGINGSNMTPFGGSLQGQDIWDLANFVSNMSYPAMRKGLELNID